MCFRIYHGTMNVPLTIPTLNMKPVFQRRALFAICTSQPPNQQTTMQADDLSADSQVKKSSANDQKQSLVAWELRYKKNNAEVGDGDDASLRKEMNQLRGEVDELKGDGRRLNYKLKKNQKGF